MRQRTVDVVVIGAGVTGLVAADQLVRGGLDVVVLEARDLVGGRLQTDRIEGQMYEIGGQWVSPDQSELIGLLAELGLPTYPRHREGESVYIAQSGERHRYSGEIFPIEPAARAELEALIAEVDALAGEVDPDSPWAHPKAQEWDSVSFDAWLRTRTDSEEVRRNVALFVSAAMLTKPATTFSLLQALHMAASAGSFDNLVDADIILDRRVVGGLARVPEELAARLGERVVLGTPVSLIRWSDDEVVVETADQQITARRALVAVPPNLYDRIAYEPTLPRIRRQAHQHQSLGLVIKVHATYATPFWREDGLSGTAFSPFETVHEAYDNTNHGEDRGTLVGFVSDLAADAMLALAPEERKAAILGSFGRYYGDAALTPEVYYESDWVSEEWTGGAYATSFDLGGLTRFGPSQHDPAGAIRFASSDLAGLGFQHVEGAIRMGRRSAEAIAADLA